MNRGAAYLAIVVATVMVTVSTGCTANVLPASGPEPTPSPQTVRVERADITPVLTLSATVESSTTFILTAPITGILESHTNGSPSVRSEAGDSQPIVVPALARVEQMLVPDGQTVAQGLPIAVARLDGFALVASLTGTDLLRFTTQPQSARAQIDGSGAPFNCDLLDPVPSIVDDRPEPFIACGVPLDQAVVSGLSGIVVSRFTGVENALALPVEAVAGSKTSGLVFKLGADGPEERPVVLGVSDGINVEIIEGLSEGDVVLTPSPTLLNG